METTPTQLPIDIAVPNEGHDFVTPIPQHLQGMLSAGETVTVTGENTDTRQFEIVEILNNGQDVRLQPAQ